MKIYERKDMSNLKIQHVGIISDKKPISQNESKRPIKSSAKPTK